jgi:hypothetical protein
VLVLVLVLVLVIAWVIVMAMAGIPVPSVVPKTIVIDSYLLGMEVVVVIPMRTM